MTSLSGSSARKRQLNSIERSLLSSTLRRIEKLEAENQKKQESSRYIELRAKSLGKFIPAITPHYSEPKHLKRLLESLENLWEGSRRVCLSVPPRHGKSDALLHYIAWLLARNPLARILYVTHTATFARKQGRVARKLSKTAGVKLSTEANRADEWETLDGGGLTSRGYDGDFTGRGFDVIIVDDPIKNRKAAESSLIREGMFESFISDIFTRLTPKGSVLVVHTRWHVDDLIGRLVKEQGYERLNLRAIAYDVPPDNDNGVNDPANDNRRDGEALWPEGGWTAEVLAERRKLIGEYAWWSLYQGEPRPRGESVFGEPHWYTELPSQGHRVAFGLDLAYTGKAQGRGDWSVIVELWRSGDTYYVVDVIRKRVPAPDFLNDMRRKARPGVRFRWDRAGGPEKGVEDFIRKARIKLDIRNASVDTFQRSLPLHGPWNNGQILLPDPDVFTDEETGEWKPGYEWVDQFLDELRDFTGTADKHDDQVAALASAFNALQMGRMLAALTAGPAIPRDTPQ